MLVDATLFLPAREEKRMLRNKLNRRKRPGTFPAFFIFRRAMRRFDMRD